ncbi:MAG: hypothetical protein AAGA54_14065 [Myxococcota bacterium]
MNDERQRLQAWLDEVAPNDETQAADAEAAWTRRAPAPVVAVAVAVAASLIAGLWLLRDEGGVEQAPASGSSLVMRVGDDLEEIRIQVRVRNQGE